MPARLPLLEVVGPRGTRIPVQCIVKPHQEKMVLNVGALGPRLAVPPKTPPQQALAFVEHHARWLEAQYLHSRQHAVPLEMGKPFKLPLLGVPTPVSWQAADFPKLIERKGELVLAVPAGMGAVRRAHALLRTHLEQTIRAFVATEMGPYVTALKRSPTSVLITPLQNLWGYMTPRDRMALDLGLALTPESVLRYVLVHELCHMLERNHQTPFWRLVGQLMPTFRDQEAWLKRNGAQAKTLMATVLGLSVDAFNGEQDGVDAGDDI